MLRCLVGLTTYKGLRTGGRCSENEEDSSSKKRKKPPRPVSIFLWLVDSSFESSPHRKTLEKQEAAEQRVRALMSKPRTG